MKRQLLNKHIHRFCQVALDLGFITEEQAREVLEEQVSKDRAARLRPQKMVGEIMLEKGWLTTRQIEMVLSQASKVRV